MRTPIAAVLTLLALLSTSCAEGAVPEETVTSLPPAAARSAVDESPSDEPELPVPVADPVDDGLLCTPIDRVETTVRTSPDWVAGESRKYELQTGQEDSSRPAFGLMNTTSVTLNVERADEQGFTFLWEMEPVAFNELLGDSAMAEAIFLEAPLQRLRYRLDRDRYWLGVENTADVRAATAETLELIGRFSSPEEAQVLGDLEAAYAAMSDETLSQLFAVEPQMLHNLEGYQITEGEVFEWLDILGNNLGGPPIPATASIRILDLVDDDGCVAIEVRSEPDAEQFAEIMAASIEAMFPASEQFAPGELEALVGGVVIRNSQIGQFDATTGYFRRITAVQRADALGTSQTSTTILTDVTP